MLGPGQARSHPGAVHTIKAGAADTCGLFTFCEDVMTPRTPGPPLDVHDEEDKCFYVLAQLQGPPDPGRIAAIWAGHTRRARSVGPPIEVAAAPAASSA